MGNVKEQIRDNRRALKVGNARVLKLATEYERLGYMVLPNLGKHEGADLLVISLPDGRIRKAIEVTNFERPDEYIANPRLDRYINDLVFFKAIEGIELELVVSYLENLSEKQLTLLKEYGIKVKVAGEQDLPEEDIVGWVE